MEVGTPVLDVFLAAILTIKYTVQKHIGRNAGTKMLRIEISRPFQK
jgi:hypothetical protein